MNLGSPNFSPNEKLNDVSIKLENLRILKKYHDFTTEYIDVLKDFYVVKGSSKSLNKQAVFLWSKTISSKYVYSALQGQGIELWAFDNSLLIS
jgi:hypothetical protein